MATAAPTRGQKAKQVALYPLDWLEDEAPELPARKGLVNPEPRNGSEK